MRGQPGSNVGGRRTLYYVTWRARITGGAYAYRLRGPAGRGCRSRQSHWLGNQRHKYSRRGHILSVTLSPPGKLYRRSGVTDGPTPQAWCPGTDKVDIAWVGHGRRYPPFATATFVVR
jgi:hypothetical protein